MRKQQERMNLFTRFFSIFVLIACILDPARALSDKRLCADENCREVISFGVGKINYPAGEEGMVSFKINSHIRIKSKGAGNNPLLWGIEVSGREGYAPKNFIRETKVLISEKDLKFVVDVNPVNAIPTLTTTEKLAEEESTIETTTTASLDFEPVETTENPLKNNSNEQFTLNGTAVQSEIVESNKIPVSVDDSDGFEKNIQSLNKFETTPENGNKIKDSDVYRKNENENQQNSNSEGTKTLANENVSDKTATIQENNLNEKIVSVKNENNSLIEESISNKSIATNNIVENMNDMNEKKATMKENENIEQEKKESENSEAFENPMSLSETLGKGTNIETLKKTELISDSETVQAFPTNSQNVTNVNVKKEGLDGTIEQNYNVEITDHTANSEHLDKEANEPQYPNDFKKGETSDTDISFDQQDDRSEKSNVENLSELFKTVNARPDENINILPTETEEANKHSDSSTNTNEEPKTTIENAKIKNSILNTSPKITEVLSNEIILDQNNYATVYNPSTEPETNIKEISENLQKNLNEVESSKPSKNDNLQSVNANFNTKEINGAEEIMNSRLIDNSNEHNSYNQQEVQTEPLYNEIQKEIGNKDHTETTDSPQKEDLINKPTSAEDSIISKSNEEVKISSNILFNLEKVSFNTPPKLSEELLNQKENMEENIKPTSNSDDPINTPPTQYDYSYQQLSTAITPPNDNYAQRSENIQENSNSFNERTTEGYESISAMPSETALPTLQKKDEKPELLPPFNDYETKETKGLFATIMGTVNNMLTINKKKRENEFEGEFELNRISFSKNKNGLEIEKTSEENILQYCENIGPNGDCPANEGNHEPSIAHFHHTHTPTKSSENSEFTLDTFLKILASKILEASELLVFLVVAAAASVIFIFGYYCFCNSSKEGSLLLKLNQLESSLLASHKENAILKHNLMFTRQKLTSIEDSSFGSNDMVVSLRKELEEELMEKARLQEQISALQKELENAADAGIELNKIVTELLGNQTGDERIISSVEELQKQLNEQQNIIYEINASLAEKSRENSELQLLIAEQNAKYETELASLRRDNDELEQEKGNLLTRLDEIRNDFDKDITVALEGKNLEIKRLQNDIVDLSNKVENEHTKWQTSVAKVEALEECLKNVRKDPYVNITEVIDVANVKAQLIEIQKKYKSLKERLETELDSRKLAENQLEVALAEVEKLKQDFNQSEKDKLEAQTRLEVLSNYFKDKENQLQKELSIKEAMWLKQQGETTTTVDRVTAMQEEIQSLKSQNDSLRAEIEAQVAAHKAQIGTLENRAHETWLAARQSDRRYEEARAEATALRRKLTALGGGNISDANKSTGGPVSLGDDLTQAHSPIHMESPGSPMLGRLPPPPFLPPPFMGPPPPFLGMPPPPPFVPPGEIRPAPLGRIMSPLPQRSGRFSPQHPDFDEYLDYEGNNPWHRHTYSPPPRTYRSLSPTNSRYDYEAERDLMSTYDTETDFSPPLTPRESRRRGGNSSERIDFNTEINYGNTKKFNTSNKGPISSGSEKSFKVLSHNGSKTKKGIPSGSGKTLV